MVTQSTLLLKDCYPRLALNPRCSKIRRPKYLDYRYMPLHLLKQLLRNCCLDAMPKSEKVSSLFWENERVSTDSTEENTDRAQSPLSACGHEDNACNSKFHAFANNTWMTKEGSLAQKWHVKKRKQKVFSIFSTTILSPNTKFKIHINLSDQKQIHIQPTTFS